MGEAGGNYKLMLARYIYEIIEYADSTNDSD